MASSTAASPEDVIAIRRLPAESLLIDRSRLVFIWVVVAVSSVALFTLRDMYRGQIELNRLALIPMPTAADLSISLVYAGAIIIGRLILAPFMSRTLGAAITNRTKWSAIEREKRIERFGHVSFKLMYFMAASTSGWFVIKDQAWMPASLFGAGDTANCWKDWPNQQVSTPLQTYYVVSLAYHVHSLVFQLAGAHRSDFWEMVVHHVSTIILIAYSYMFNLVRIGSLVLWLHDAGDVSTYMVKSVVDTKYTCATLIAYSFVLVSWGYMRLYVLPSVVIPATFADFANFVPNVWFLRGLLLILCALHIYWYTLFLRIGWTYIATGLTEDVIDDIKTDQTLVAAEGSRWTKKTN